MRHALIHDWRERLDANQAQAQRAAPRTAWLFHTRARIYRLLLAMYGQGEWRADRDERGEEHLPPLTSHPQSISPDSRAVPVAPESVESQAAGKPLKSLSDIRKTLKAVRSAVDAPSAGEFVHGAPDELSSVAQGAAIVFSSLERSELARAMSSLRARLVDHSLQNGHILVREIDRERALAILASDRQRQKSLRNRHLGQNNCSARKSLLVLLSLVAGSAICFTVIPALRSNRDWQPGEIAAAYFALSIAWVGAILYLNRVRQQRR